jgi:phosphoribosylformylglycinamidine synthase
MLIGLGGGAASSMASGASEEDLDFASVQRDNAEMQRRCQEVIDRCCALGEASPIVSIHDVGAGGLSNALPELVNDSHARRPLRAAQDPQRRARHVAAGHLVQRSARALRPGRLRRRLDEFEALCRRERCPFAVLGHATAEGTLAVTDSHFDNQPIDMPLSVLLGKPPKMVRDVKHAPIAQQAFSTAGIDLREAITRVLRLPPWRTRPSSSPSATARSRG